jgi:hypothetical protein
LTRGDNQTSEPLNELAEIRVCVDFKNAAKRERQLFKLSFRRAPTTLGGNEASRCDKAANDRDRWTGFFYVASVAGRRDDGNDPNHDRKNNETGIPKTLTRKLASFFVFIDRTVFVDHVSGPSARTIGGHRYKPHEQARNRA